MSDDVRPIPSRGAASQSSSGQVMADPHSAGPQDGEARLKLALDAGRMGAWEWDVVTGRVSWSETLEEIHGIPRGSFTGSFEAYQSDIHPEDKARVLHSIRTAVEDCHDHEVEYRIIRPDGIVRWLQANGRLVCDPRGNPLRMLGVCRDVTSRKQAELALRMSEAWLSTTLLSIGDAILTTDDAGRITLMNRVAEDLTGWTSVEARGRPLDDVFRILSQRTREPVPSPVAKVLELGSVAELTADVVLVRRDGSEIAIDDSAAPIREDSDGRVVGVVLVFRDVSDRRREEARRAFLANAMAVLASSLDSESTLTSIAQLAVPEIADWCLIDVFGEDGVLRRIATAHENSEQVRFAEKVWAHPALRQNAVDVARRGKREVVRELLAPTPASSEPEIAHIEGLRALGVSSYAVLPLRAGEEIFGTIALLTANSKRSLSDADVALAEQLSHSAALALKNAQLYERARRAVSVRDDLLAIVSHDLRTPMQVLSLKLHMLQSDPIRTEEQLARDVGAMRRATLQLERLIGDLTDYATIESGNLTITRSAHSLQHLSNEVLEMLQASATARGIGLEWSVEVDTQVICDKERVAQVLSNIVGNAIKFSPERSTIRVTATLRETDILFCVSDQGPGIRPEQRARIFERYWKGTGGRRESLGLGLFIARGIILAHGGQIWVESPPGAGTKFSFTLPRSVA